MKPAKLTSPLVHAEMAIRQAIATAQRTAEVAVMHAVRAGHLMHEAKPLLGHGNFQEWIEETFPEISYATARRWMGAAENVIRLSGVGDRQLTAPVSDLLAADPPHGMDAGDMEARQLLLDFTSGKTIRDCLAGVIVEGDDAHRITRAHNGRTAGGHLGEDRKDFPKFIGVHLSDITAHLRSWKAFTGVMIEVVEGKFKGAIGKWPTPLLEAIRKIINDELKTR